MTFVHPFDDPQVIAGQGTIALEILDDMPDVECIIVPIGGGGLISGVAYAAKQINPKIKVYGVQAEGAPSMYNSLAHDTIERLDSVSTIADGIAVKEPGKNTFECCKKWVDEVVTVSEDEVCAAILHLLEKYKITAEGAGAVSVAAAMYGKVPVDGKRTVCIVSGGNVDVTFLSRIISRGLVKSGRECTLALELADKPGQLHEVTQVIAQLGANVLSVIHERSANQVANVNSCILRVAMETRNHEHIRQIIDALNAKGIRTIE